MFAGLTLVVGIVYICTQAHTNQYKTDIDSWFDPNKETARMRFIQSRVSVYFPKVFANKIYINLFQLRCCGKNGPSDYNINVTGTCCGKVTMSKTVSCEVMNVTVFETGCYSAHKENIAIKYIIFSIIYLLVALASACCSLFTLLLRKEIIQKDPSYVPKVKVSKEKIPKDESKMKVSKDDSKMKVSKDDSKTKVADPKTKAPATK